MARHQRPLCAKGAPAKRVGDCRSPSFYNPSVTASRATSLYTREALQCAAKPINSPLNINLSISNFDLSVGLKWLHGNEIVHANLVGDDVLGVPRHMHLQLLNGENSYETRIFA